MHLPLIEDIAPAALPFPSHRCSSLRGFIVIRAKHAIMSPITHSCYNPISWPHFTVPLLGRVFYTRPLCSPSPRAPELYLRGSSAPGPALDGETPGLEPHDTLDEAFEGD